jgi:hypothetical protein
VLLEEKGIDLAVFEEPVADAREAAVEEAVAAGAIAPERPGWMGQPQTAFGLLPMFTGL